MLPTTNTLLKKISDKLDSLPAMQKRVALAYLESPELFTCFSLEQLSQKINISQATIIRFCRSIGFSGFLEFSKELQQMLQVHLSATDRFFIENDNLNNNSEITLIDNLIQQARSELESANNILFSSSFRDCITKLHNADNIFVIARLSSVPLAQKFCHLMSKFRSNIFFLENNDIKNFSLLQKITDKSFVVSIAFPRYPKETILLTEVAAQKNAEILAITNSKLCPIAQSAHYCFITPVLKTSYLDLNLSAYFLITCLAYVYGERYLEEAKEKMNSYDDYADLFSLFIKNSDKK